MSDDEKLQKSISKGARADALLKSDVFMEACAKLTESYITAWRQTPAKDTEAREKLWIAVNQIEKIRSHLVSMASDGKLSQKELEQLTADEERKRQRKAAS